VHHAFYEFDSMAKAQAIPSSDALKRLVVGCDRVWGDIETRSRDLVEVVQTFSP
jgi:hypothetical protein